MHDVLRKIVAERLDKYDFLSVFIVFSACTTCTQVRGSKQKSSVDKEGVDLGGGVILYIYICIRMHMHLKKNLVCGLAFRL